MEFLKHVVHREYPLKKSYGKLIRVNGILKYLRYKHKEINKNKLPPKIVSELTFEYIDIQNIREFFKHYRSTSLNEWVEVETLDYLSI